mmetsp:Transcript_10864/g.15218  ORF Transcript_10864/g.15218 Transcript_10864/m.15218 type:complete len:400 (+) Transcript_10864:69-1268(+)
MKFTALALALFAAPAAAEIYFKEQFDDSYTSRWTESTTWKSAAEMGKWELTAGDIYGDAEDKGIKTTEDHRFYGISAPLTKPYVSGGKPLVLQYAMRYDKDIECGGAYIKLLPGGAKFDSAAFGGDAPYGVMFGPDMCGSSNKRTHVILHSDAKDDNLLITKDVPCEKDNISHLYTLVVNPDNTFEVRVDDKVVREGKLDDEFDFLPAKEIKDPDASKPTDWVDNAKIEDPDVSKPEGYDDIPAEIPDPMAVKPEDWDDEDDGEWEAPTLDNPDYKGPWQQPMIDNPDYKGPWEHPMVANPDFKYDDNMYKVCGGDGCSHIGFELWQVKAGTLFDDIIVTDSLEEAQSFAKETFFKKKEAEKEMYDKQQAEEEKAREAEYASMDDHDNEEDMDGMFDEF